MKTLILKIVRFRNPDFRFDGAVTSAVLVNFAWSQLVSLGRGLRILLRFRNPNGIIVGRGVRFFNLGKIRWGRFVKLGDQVRLSALGREGITLGDGVGIGSYSQIIVSTSLNNIGTHIRIGNRVGIGEFAYLGGAGGLTIGDDTIVGQYFSCHPENHLFNDLITPIRLQGTARAGITVGKNCWIGSKVTILDGVRLGDGCVVAAGAVVTRSFPDNSVIGGVPAKLIKTRNS